MTINYENYSHPHQPRSGCRFFRLAGEAVFPGWDKAEVKFVPAGKTLNSNPPDVDPEIIHVDTGLGKFDHHTTGDKSVCAAVKVLGRLKKRIMSKKSCHRSFREDGRNCKERGPLPKRGHGRIRCPTDGSLFWK